MKVCEKQKIKQETFLPDIYVEIRSLTISEIIYGYIKASSCGLNGCESPYRPAATDHYIWLSSCTRHTLAKALGIPNP